MNRSALAAIAALLIVAGILTVVTGRAMRRRASEPATAVKTWQEPDDSWKSEPLLKSYQLTDRSGRLIGTNDLDGAVHVASFFFASCPNTCFAQNKAIETLQQQFVDKPVKFLSISCNPETDSPDVLKEYAKKFTAPADQWYFLTGDMDHIRRIGGEIYQVHVDRMVHLDRLIVVDKWGKVRGSFHWKEPEKMAECKWLVAKLLDEQAPPVEEPPAARPAPAAAADDE